MLNIFKNGMTLIAKVFPKLRTLKNMVRSICKKFCFKGSFGKQHGKLAQTLLKFERQRICDIYWSLCRQLACKKPLLVTCKISTLFPNTLSADGKYSLLTWENLFNATNSHAIISKTKKLSQFYCGFLKASSNLEHFQQKYDSHRSDISEITDCEKHG